MKLHMLVIEDNEGDFVLIENYLADQILQPVTRAENYRSAAALLKAGNIFDIILLDLTLPDNTGEQLITDILAACGDCPVIVLTGHSNIQFGIRSLSLGIADYLIKDDINASVLYKSILYTIERKRSNNALKDSEKKYSDLFHISPLPMWVFDIKTKCFLDVNLAAIEKYGYSRDEFLKMNVMNIKIANSGENGNYESKPGKEITEKHVKKCGEIIEAEVKNNALLFNGKEACISLSIDVTERTRYIEAIEKQNAQLQQIAWKQSHEVRAPVARIMGLIDLLKNHTLTDNEKGAYYLYILDSANELDIIIKEIVKKAEQVQLNTNT